MKKILCLLLLACSLLNLTAQDKKAEQILKSVAGKYKSFKTYKADYKYLLENKRDKLYITKKGALFVKTAKYRLEMGTMTIICDGKTLWNFNKDNNEVQVSDYDPANAEVNPSKIFSIYDKGYLSQFIEEKTENGRIMQLIELTPIDKKKSFFKIKLYIDKGLSQICRSKIFDKNGNVYTYEVLKFQGHIKIKDHFFNFNKKDYPGVEILDLR
jgi:outer membrane lipoprotein-sorting protein